MVSISIFSIVMVMCMGSILTVLNSNRKSQSLRAIMDNLDYSLDSMTRNIRFGTVYHCDESVSPINSPRDCVSASSIVFTRSDGAQVIYRLNGTHIEETVSNSLIGTDNGTFSMTSPDVTIQTFSFAVSGSLPYPPSGSTCLSIGYDCLQPEVIIVIKGYAGASNETQSSFSLETTVSQKTFDF